MRIKDPDKILILDFLAIGDLIFTTPLLRTLRMNYENAQIVVSINKDIEDVLAYNPNIDMIIPFDKRGEDAGLNYLKYIKSLRQVKPDLTITLQDNPRLSLLALFSGAPKRIGFARHIRKAFYTNPVEADHAQHRVEYYLDIARELGVKKIYNQGLEFYPSESAEEWANSFLKKQNLNFENDLIGLNIGGSWKTKLWPTEKFAALADKLLKEKYDVILLGGPGDLDRGKQIIKKMELSPISLVGKTDLMELAAVIDKIDLLVSGDTGPLHIAAARQTKSIALFGPTEIWRYKPYGKQHIVLSVGLECQPCHQKKCSRNLECMKNIEVENVFSVIKGEVK